MRIEVYGRQGCKLCESAKKKIEHFLEKWGVGKEHEIIFVDMESEFGAAEGDFYDVFHVPTVLLKKGESEIVARWDGEAPPSEQLEKHIRRSDSTSAAA